MRSSAVHGMSLREAFSPFPRVQVPCNGILEMPFMGASGEDQKETTVTTANDGHRDVLEIASETLGAQFVTGGDLQEHHTSTDNTDRIQDYYDVVQKDSDTIAVEGAMARTKHVDPDSAAHFMQADAQGEFGDDVLAIDRNRTVTGFHTMDFSMHTRDTPPNHPEGTATLSTNSSSLPPQWAVPSCMTKQERYARATYDASGQFHNPSQQQGRVLPPTRR